jgi:hypothetical protein
MKIKILKQLEIQGCPVIIRQVGKEMFEYLLVFKGKFYGTFITNNLKWWELKRFKKEPCTDKEIKAMIHFLEKAAETTIEVLQNPHKEIKK